MITEVCKLLMRGRKAPWHKHSCFTTAAFYDCVDGKEASGSLQGGSLANCQEAALAAQLFQSAPPTSFRSLFRMIGSITVCFLPVSGR